LKQVQRPLRVLLCALVAIGVLLPGTAASADPSPQEVERQLEKAHDDLEHVIEDYNKIGEELKANQAAVDAVNAQLAPMQAQFDAAQSDVAVLARSAYKSGGGLANVQVLIGSSSADTMVAQLEAVRRASRSRQHDVSAYADAKAKYEAEKRRLDQLLADSRKKQADLAAHKTEIEGQIKTLDEQEAKFTAQQAARGTPRQSSQSAQPSQPAPTGSGKGAVAVRFAYAQLGKPYVFGADGPGSYDCSGLTMAAWNAAGVGLPHNAAMQYNSIPHVSRSALSPGDLVFSNGLGHVTIYIGNGQVISAPTSGRNVQVQSLPSSVNGYGRPG
jgi:cell wall-associated NlpC family hydrolase